MDDALANREAVADVLRFHGHEVDALDSGADALAWLDGTPPDAVVLDVLLPGADGLAVLHAMRRRDAWRAVPVVLVTGLPVRDVLARLSFPADAPVAVLAKPFEAAALEEALRQAEARGA